MLSICKLHSTGITSSHPTLFSEPAHQLSYLHFVQPLADWAVQLLSGLFWVLVPHSTLLRSEAVTLAACPWLVCVGVGLAATVVLETVPMMSVLAWLVVPAA